MPERTYVAINVRLPPELHAAVKAIAQQEARSLNAQIVVMLRRAVAQYRQVHPE